MPEKNNDFTSRFKPKKKTPTTTKDTETKVTEETAATLELSRDLETNKSTNNANEGNVKELEQLEIQALKEQLALIITHLNNDTNESSKELKKGFKRRSFDLPKNVVSRLKIEAAFTNKYMNEILVEALENWFEQKGKVPEQLIDIMGDNNE